MKYFEYSKISQIFAPQFNLSTNKYVNQIMATKMRLQRYGKKGQPFYHIVIADGRAPRDGRFIEKIGVYNPLTVPATIELDMDKALSWIQKGAVPTDTTRAILSYKGVMYKNHLLKGVAKGALTQEAAEAKFQNWLTEKQAKISSKINQKAQESKSEIKKRLEAEAKIKEEREKALAAKRAKALEKEAKLEEEAPVEEVKTEEPEIPAAEEPKTEA
jgi:small subunit ribosomal protein S16